MIEVLNKTPLLLITMRVMIKIQILRAKIKDNQIDVNNLNTVLCIVPAIWFQVSRHLTGYLFERKYQSENVNTLFLIRITVISIYRLKFLNPNLGGLWRPTWLLVKKIFWRYRVPLANFSYWPKFHVNVISGYRVITVFLYKRLTINPEIRYTPVWVLPNIWRLRQVRDTNFGTNVFSKMLLNAAKCQSYSFYRFWFIKGKPIGEVKHIGSLK